MGRFQSRIRFARRFFNARATLALLGLALCLGALALVGLPASAQAPAEANETPLNLLPGMPAVIDPSNLYSEARAGNFSAAVAAALERIYVPNVLSGDVSVIDPKTMTVIDRFDAGRNPQHVVPSYDLKTLWVAGSATARGGSLTPIDPTTGKPGKTIVVPDAYNLYFSPDGHYALVIAEAMQTIEFRDAKTMEPRWTLTAPQCGGLNHADFSIDGRYAIFTCEFAGTLIKVDMADLYVVGTIKLSKGGMPQDIRVSPDGKVFYVADMMADGVFLIDGEKFTEIGFIPTGIAAHGLYPSRDGKQLYVVNRGTHALGGVPRAAGSVSIVDFATRNVTGTWPIPGGGSPDMGNVSADGTYLWLSARYNDMVYRIDMASGEVKTIKVGEGPHGLAVWPQPGRYSLGHTGNMR